jgi:hypothetical protein
MTRAHESGAYQGAISSMAAVADVCPSCGGLLSRHRRSAFGAPDGCPNVAMGLFPFIEESSERTYDDDEPHTAPTSTSPNAFPPTADEAPTGLFATVHPASRGARRSDLLAMTWSLTHGSEEFL